MIYEDPSKVVAMKLRRPKKAKVISDNLVDVADVAVLSGTVAGAAAGAIAGPVGVVVGTAIGAEVGALAGEMMREDEERLREQTDKLDHEIGIIGGSIGAVFPGKKPSKDE